MKESKGGKKNKPKQNYLCFLTHAYAYLQNSAKSYYMSLKRGKGTCLVFSDRRGSISETVLTDGTVKTTLGKEITSSFLSRQNQGLTGCVMPQELPIATKLKNPSPSLSLPSCASYLIVREALIFVTWKWQTCLLILQKQMTVTTYHNH